MISAITAQIWSSIPANFKAVRHLVNQLSPEDPEITIKAPTGSGKSTSLVAMVWRDAAVKYEKFIVIVPRRLLAIGISQYMKNSFGMDATAYTSNYPRSETARVVYTTSGEFLQMEEWWRSNNLFMIDECHINEPMHQMAMRVLQKLRKPTIYASATPSEIRGLSVEVPVAAIWKIEENSMDLGLTPASTYGDYIRDYRAALTGLVNASHPATRFLLFVVDKKLGNELAASFDRRVCFLNSDQPLVDDKASVFIATSVADVGITIPDVDWVVSSDVTRTVQSSGLGSSLSVVHKLSSSTIKQRRGRTGRTCNGRFTLFKAKGAFIEVLPEQSNLVVGHACLSGGVPASVIARFLPDYITMLTKNKAYDREDDAYIDLWSRTFSAAINELDSEEGISTIKSGDFDLADGSSGPAFIAHGNIFKSGTRDSGEPDALTSDQMMRFLTWATTYATNRSADIFKVGWRHYFRNAKGINGLTFKRVFQDIANANEAEETLHEKSGRYTFGAMLPSSFQDPPEPPGRPMPGLPKGWDEYLTD